MTPKARIQLEIPWSLNEQVKALAESRGISRNQLIVDILNQALRGEKGE